MPSSKRSVRYFAASADTGGAPHVSVATGTLKYAGSLPAGYAEVHPIEAGACTSELYYFGRRETGHPSRFESDVSDSQKRAQYEGRNRQAGLDSGPQSLAAFEQVLTRSMFHEGFCRILAAKRSDTTPVPVLSYEVEGFGAQARFKRLITPRTLEESLESGRLAVRNPSFVCREHASAERINPSTGWPYQCDRSTAGGHEPKGTIGHTEFLGTAVAGDFRVPLHALTPVPDPLQAYVEKDIPRRGRLLSLAEPLGCVFEAFGTLLEKGESPKRVLLIGDGTSALNVILFLRVFAPEVRILVVGKYALKLMSLRALNPERIEVLETDGKDLSMLVPRMKAHFGSDRADLVMPTVPLPKELVDPLVENGGTLIWWAAEIAEIAPEPVKMGRYLERFSYGGAPHAEFSALALLDYFAASEPEILERYLDYAGFYTVRLDAQGASDIEEWLRHDGRLFKEVATPVGSGIIPVKPLIELSS